jgi:hypothetical protein
MEAFTLRKRARRQQERLLNPRTPAPKPAPRMTDKELQALERAAWVRRQKLVRQAREGNAVAAATLQKEFRLRVYTNTEVAAYQETQRDQR